MSTTCTSPCASFWLKGLTASFAASSPAEATCPDAATISTRSVVSVTSASPPVAAARRTPATDASPMRDGSSSSASASCARHTMVAVLALSMASCSSVRPLGKPSKLLIVLGSNILPRLNASSRSSPRCDLALSAAVACAACFASAPFAFSCSARSASFRPTSASFFFCSELFPLADLFFALNMLDRAFDTTLPVPPAVSNASSPSSTSSSVLFVNMNDSSNCSRLNRITSEGVTASATISESPNASLSSSASPRSASSLST
mmetsp:Transcript_36345/g.95521  ORF Transcript_36345/g.95521 Transcript_36345/m.95521 type:complete len:262 (-) Transcript_36345:52-837(-)